MPRIDLHTHSTASHDGGIRAVQYRNLLTSKRIDVIAVTDHNRIDFAQELHRELGDKIIVGEEVMTTEGELVGLFLQEVVPAGLSPLETAKAIRKQGGLVYVPHPFETVRKGLQASTLDAIAKYIDIVEVQNGRAFLQKRSSLAADWAQKHGKIMAASSDAHGAKGVGHTYSLIPLVPTRKNFLDILAAAQLVAGRAPLRTLTYPKLNRLHKKLRRKS